MTLKPSAGFTHCIPVIPIADLDATLAYYQTTLEILPQWRDGDDFAAVWAGDVVMFLRPAPAGFTPAEIVLNLDDVDVLHARYQRAGADIVEGLETRPWGMREFAVRELNGHVFRIGSLDESRADYNGFGSLPSEEP